MVGLLSPRRAARAIAFACGAATLVLVGSAMPAHALRVCTWNMLRYYPTTIDFADRQTNFRTVMAALGPSIDVLATQEIDQSTSRDSFLTNVLNVVEPGEWAAASWIDVGTGEGMCVFYKPAKVSIASASAISGGTRSVYRCLVRPVGYPSSVSFQLYSIHLKAGDPTTTPADSATRRIDGTTIRNQLNNLLAGTQFLLVGDSNFYGDWEGGFIRLTESQMDNDGRVSDPLGLGGTWHVQSLYKKYDTQSPCYSNCLTSDFSAGGMDDRFDLILASTAMTDGASFDLVPNSTVAYGNDGQHFNTDLNADGFNNAVGYAVATALRNSSDHIPVYADVQVPAKVAGPSALDFGRVIVGGVGGQGFAVWNPATPPADELNYSFAAPANFVPPAGSFVANAGDIPNLHVIQMNAPSVGPQSGTMFINSNAADTASKQVLLSGTVIRHATPSFDSTSVVQSTSADFGDHAILHFADQDVRVHDQGFDALQAQLSLDAATITGGAGRFSIVGGFSSSLQGSVGRTFTLHFDSYGATLDSTYTGTLTFSSSDEPLPGATSCPDLTVTLRARPISGVLGAGPRPPVLRFESAHPNPFGTDTRFAFELPRAQSATLDVYDLSGRRVAALASGQQSAGRHELTWNARDLRGERLPGGLYFARFVTPGLSRLERVVVLP